MRRLRKDKKLYYVTVDRQFNQCHERCGLVTKLVPVLSNDLEVFYLDVSFTGNDTADVGVPAKSSHCRLSQS
jgi:hypothetical protein